MAKKVIAIDLDEVLGAFVPSLCDYHNERYGTQLKLSDFFSYRFRDVWGGTVEESIEKVHEFFKTKYFQEIPVVPGAPEGLAALRAKGYELVIVTSRQLVIERNTRDWLAKNFPDGTFSRIEFGNHWGKDGLKRTKAEICRLVGASVLIDDSLAYTSEVASDGFNAILFDLDGSYPWNRSESLPSGVTRVTSWDMVVEKVTSLLREY